MILWQYLLRIQALMYEIEEDHQGATHSDSIATQRAR